MKDFNSLIHQIFIDVIPNEDEIKAINILIKDILKKKYKKVIFYSFGTNNKIVRLVEQFYYFNSHTFRSEILCSYDPQTVFYLLNSINKDILIVFLSRSGNTFELVNVLDIILSKASSMCLLENIIVFTSVQDDNKVMRIIEKYKVKKYNVKKGICGRFEFTNSITLFLIKLFNPKVELLSLYMELNNINFYSNLRESNKNLFIDFPLTNPIILYSADSRLSGFLQWIRHLWYETFGHNIINLHCEDYSSLFHCSIQHYFNHQDIHYNFINLYTKAENVKYVEHNFLFKLNKVNSVNIFVDSEKDNGLIGTMSDIVMSILQLMIRNKIDYFNQEYVDNYKLENINSKLLS